MIYLWHDKDLARDFNNSTVSIGHKFFYFLAFLLFADSGGIFSLSKNFSGLTYVITSLITLGVVLWTAYDFYQTNQKGNGKDFIERFVCLSFPVYIRSLLWCAPFFLFLFLHIFSLSWILLILYFVWYYHRLNMLFKIASGQGE